MFKNILSLFFFFFVVYSQDTLNCNIVVTPDLYGFSKFTGIGNTVYFSACSSTDLDCEIYSTKGDISSQTKIVVFPGTNQSFPDDLTNFQDTLFFTSRNTSGNRVIMKRNQDGSILVVDQPINPLYLSPINNKLYFISQDYNGVARPQVKLNTSSGFDSFASTTSPQVIPNFYSCKGNIIFNTDSGTGQSVHISDGLPGSSKSFRQNQLLTGSNFIDFNGYVYYNAYYIGSGIELIRTTCELKSNSSYLIDINAGRASSNPQYLTVFNNRLYFVAMVAGKINLYFLNTTGGINEVKGVGSYGNNLIAFGDRLYFVAINFNDYTFNLYSLDKSDITRVLLFNFTSTPYFTIMGNSLIFSATYNSSYGNELCLINMYSPDNVTLAADIYPGSNSSYPLYLYTFNNILYFQSNYPTSTMYSCNIVSNTPSPTIQSTNQVITTIQPTISPSLTSVPQTAIPTSLVNTSVVVNAGKPKKKKKDWPLWSIIISAVSGSVILISIIIFASIFLKK